MDILDATTLQQLCSKLSISTATGRNWLRGGTICFENNSFVYKGEDFEKKKLTSRANKYKSGKTFIPSELIADASNQYNVEGTIQKLKVLTDRADLAVLLSAIFVLHDKNVIDGDDINLFQKSGRFSLNKKYKALELVLNSIVSDSNIVFPDFDSAIFSNFSLIDDMLGIVYQSFLLEGEKSKKGSYYTPEIVVKDIVSDYKDVKKILDPCCGSGQFLLAFAKAGHDFDKLYGIDFDEIATFISKINLMLFFEKYDKEPNILHANSLTLNSDNLFSRRDDCFNDFDLVATNPPWGAKLDKTDTETLKRIYPEIRSKESFSFFLAQAMRMLKAGGAISFILPESILNVPTHKDIRKKLIESTTITKINHLGRIFDNVYTPVIRMDVVLEKPKSNKLVVIQANKNSFSVSQTRFSQNSLSIFDTSVSPFDESIIKKIYGTRHETLENAADWALGIVTGNNKKFLRESRKEKCEAVYRGKDLLPYRLGVPKQFIEFLPNDFQQTAPEIKYRKKEKLIYKFISSKLVFAYDCKSSLTLNSANILIPKIPKYDMKVILALLNSSVHQFIFSKKFASIKVLKAHIEALPIPEIPKKFQERIVRLVNKAIEGDVHAIQLIDDLIAKEIFNLSNKDIIHIKNNI
jgi:type I restriction-modification system DNA methylase subunit